MNPPPPRAPAAPLAPIGGERRRAIPAWLGAFLRVKLATKLVGANALIVIGALVASTTVQGGRLQDSGMLAILGGALVGSLVVNLVLVTLALRPLADLEATAQRILRGDLSARVPDSPLADRDLRRVGGAINVLLEGLTADRARVRELAGRVIHAGDEERAHIARELHDSTAQTLAALLLELSVVTRETHDPASLERMERVRRIASDVLDEVRMLAHEVHPRVLDDLGLGAALQNLARGSELRGDTRIEVVLEDSAADISLDVSAVLYRVAQEALKNALQHAGASVVLLRAEVRGRTARLEIVDDGSGFRVEDAERRRPGMGLFTMRERVALLDGGLEIDSTPGRGTRVIASVPLATAETSHATGVGAATET